MENPSSPLDTLRQLKEMLDAGALTPTEFEALKQRLVFSPSAAPAAPEALADPETPAAPTAPTLPGPDATPAASASSLPPSGPTDDAGTVEWRPATSAHEVAAPVFEPTPEPTFMPEASANFPVTVEGASYVEADAFTDAAGPVETPPVGSNSSLGLVLAIGAVLVFLAVVAYLGFTRPATDEHISSLSQTSADSASTTIETGPQVAPLPATTAAPETVRVAPTNPAPVIQPRPAAPATDSAAPATTAPATDSTANQQ